MADVPERLAKAIFDSNRHLGTFDVQLEDPDRASLVASALRRLGCDVEADESGLHLTVLCKPAQSDYVRGY